MLVPHFNTKDPCLCAVLVLFSLVFTKIFSCISFSQLSINMKKMCLFKKIFIWGILPAVVCSALYYLLMCLLVNASSLNNLGPGLRDSIRGYCASCCLTSLC